jgi:hypothetical protein
MAKSGLKFPTWTSSNSSKTLVSLDEEDGDRRHIASSKFGYCLCTKFVCRIAAAPDPETSNLFLN